MRKPWLALGGLSLLSGLIFGLSPQQAFSATSLPAAQTLSPSTAFTATASPPVSPGSPSPSVSGSSAPIPKALPHAGDGGGYDDSIFVTGYVLYGRTASGALTAPGVAACPWWWAFGQVVDLEGVGRVVCADRYASWLSMRIDVWVNSVRRAYALTGWHGYSLAGSGEPSGQ